MKLFTNFKKKGQAGIMDALPSIAIAFVLAAVVFAVGMLITSETGEEMDANSAEYNATQDAIEGMGNVTGKFPLFGVVIGAVVVIALIVGGFAINARRR